MVRFPSLSRTEISVRGARVVPPISDQSTVPSRRCAAGHVAARRFRPRGISRGKTHDFAQLRQFPSSPHTARTRAAAHVVVLILGEAAPEHDRQYIRLAYQPPATEQAASCENLMRRATRESTLILGARTRRARAGFAVCAALLASRGARQKKKRRPDPSEYERRLRMGRCRRPGVFVRGASSAGSRRRAGILEWTGDSQTRTQGDLTGLGGLVRSTWRADTRAAAVSTGPSVLACVQRRPLIIR
jgi:hypothetical protein